MSIYFIAVMVFVGCFGVVVSSLYFLVEVPGARRKLRARLAAVEQATWHSDMEPEAELATREIEAAIPWPFRWMFTAPGVTRAQLFITQAGLETLVWVPIFLSMLLCVAGYALSLVFRTPFVLGLAMAGLAGSVPYSVITWKRHRRFRRFEEIFPEAMDMLARAVRAGYAATSAFSLIAEEMPEPVSGEFRILYEQQNLGLPLWKALDNLSTRLPLPDVRIFCTTMRIQQETGGNLAEVLDKLSHVIRERFRLLRQVQVYTAEGRLSMTILMALPPAMAFLLYLVNADYMTSLFTDQLGLRMVTFAVIMQLLGFLVIRKIIQIRV